MQNGFEVFFEISARISPRTMPRPDAMLARHVPPNGPIERDDVALMVEITDTTHDVDLGPKPRIYAEAGVPEYWVVDLKALVVHRMWEAGADMYARRDTVTFGDPLVSETIAGLKVTTIGF